VWLWFHAESLNFPLRFNQTDNIRWTPPTYTAIHHILTNPVYAGAYTYGKTRRERYVDDQGQIKKRICHLPQSEWAVLIPEHHEGYIDWDTYEANQARLDSNTRPQPHQGGGALREGTALLQGLATCGHCGRRLRTHYRGRNVTPGYHCAGKDIVSGRGVYCLNVGGVQIDEAVTQTFLEALEPAGIQAALCAAQQLEADHDTALAQWQLAVERARYEAERAERRYRAVEPENRLVARGLETEWEERLRELDQAQAELTRRKQQGAQRPAGTRSRSPTGLVRPHHHIPRPKGATARPARRGHHRRLPGGLPGASDAALARRTAERAQHQLASLSTRYRTHR